MGLFDAFFQKKKKRKTLFIKAKDVFEFIKSDYDNDMMFALIEFIYNDKKYMMGSTLNDPDNEMKKENIIFVFNENKYTSYDEFIENVVIDGIKLFDSEVVIEVIKAGIVEGFGAILATPWGDKRFAEKAIEVEDQNLSN